MRTRMGMKAIIRLNNKTNNEEKYSPQPTEFQRIRVGSEFFHELPLEKTDLPSKQEAPQSFTQ